MSKLKENESIEIMKGYIQDFTCDGGKYPYLVDSMKLIIRLVDKQQEEIKELKLITNTYDSYVGKDMNHTKIIIADSNYFVNGTFIEKYISKDKIRDKIKDLKNNLKSKEEQNEYFETLAKIEILEELLRW